MLVELKPGYYLLDNETGELGTFDKDKAKEFNNVTEAGNALNRARDYEKFPEAVIEDDFL